MISSGSLVVPSFLFLFLFLWSESESEEHRHHHQKGSSRRREPLLLRLWANRRRRLRPLRRGLLLAWEQLALVWVLLLAHLVEESLVDCHRRCPTDQSAWQWRRRVGTAWSVLPAVAMALERHHLQGSRLPELPFPTFLDLNRLVLVDFHLQHLCH